MIIKVCGMTQPANIADVAAAGADWVGLIFYPPSPRYVAKAAPPAAGKLPGGVKKAGVFVDAPAREIVARVAGFGLDIVQLHGNEPPAALRDLRRTLGATAGPGIRIVKTVSVGSPADMARCADYEGCADLLLFDTRCQGAGGSGRQFDWAALGAYGGSLPFMLSGGIGPGDEWRIASLTHPRLAGVDINSRFETAPGVKDAALVGKFIARLRKLAEAQTYTETKPTGYE